MRDKQQEKTLPPGLRHFFLHGEHGLFNDDGPLTHDEKMEALLLIGGGPRRDRELIKLWRCYGPALVSQWVREHPGTRPAGWWLFEAHQDPPGDQAAYLIEHGLLFKREQSFMLGPSCSTWSE